MSKGRSKKHPGPVDLFKTNRPFQSAVVILIMMVVASGFFFLVPNYYVETKETFPDRTVYHNGTYDFKGDPHFLVDDGDQDLKERTSYKLQSSWYQNSRMFIIVGLILGIIVYAGIAIFIALGKRAQMWPSLFIALGFVPPALVLLGCFRQIGDHLAFSNLNSIYETMGLEWNIFVLFPSLYVVAFICVLILATT